MDGQSSWPTLTTCLEIPIAEELVQISARMDINSMDLAKALAEAAANQAGGMGTGGLVAGDDASHPAYIAMDGSSGVYGASVNGLYGNWAADESQSQQQQQQQQQLLLQQQQQQQAHHQQQQQFVLGPGTMGMAATGSGSNSLDLAALAVRAAGSAPVSFRGISTESALITLNCVLPNGSARLIGLPLFTSFTQFLNMLMEEFGQPLTFEYVDEEGERIAVKNDSDLEEMMTMYFYLQSNPATAAPVTLHVQLNSTSRRNKNNLLSLKVDVSDMAAAQPSGHLQAGNENMPASHSMVPPVDADTVERFSRVRVIHEELQPLATLGHGASGTVQKVLHEPTGSILALKIIPLDPNLQVQQASAKQIITELDVLHKCESPDIITFYGAYFRDHCICMCMEYMDGGSLESMYKAIGTIPEPVLGRVIVSVVNGLVYLHNQFKILHRDVKPSNILLNTRGEIKLCDFGVSGKLENSMAQTFVGTNAYMAPERIRGAPYTVRSDVWSLGISIVEMATGRFPYPQDTSNTARQLNTFELLYSIVEEPVPRLSDDAFSPELIDFVRCCLVKQQDQRPTPLLLQGHPFYLSTASQYLNIAQWVVSALEYMRMPKRT
ncbi:hypothetical protein, variant 1 [Capsaspora owczarzaki ATCC 30864]|uniref:mitogen-activated protein kinase kinase n=2 Tax=Capsaspora owczarzaki (strain ATCC 30864) TaxID=595528 RepID=A0A0D2WGU7_CAPO3|nr:hypothetical protein, variant 1 [Capsaspora owczarzaki ATCC 30864]